MTTTRTIVASLALLSVALPFAACSSAGKATDAPDAAPPDDDGASPENPGPPCPASGIAKGPLSLAMTRTSVIVRWEACRPDATPGLVFRPEGGAAGGAGAADVSVATTAKAFVLKQRHTAVLGPQRSPDDVPRHGLHA